MRILVIEDEHGIVDFVERALRSQGHDVSVASDGLEGERLALTSGVDQTFAHHQLADSDVVARGLGGAGMIAIGLIHLLDAPGKFMRRRTWAGCTSP